MKKQQKISPKNASFGGDVRIIAGVWRGRKLPVLNADGLRPTGDRLKETLFNWLMGEMPETKVLDCFAGSGSLGLEALSRGASSAVFIEKNPQASKQLEKNLQSLKTHKGKVILGDSLNFLANPNGQTFDLIFVDPPFHFGLAQKTVDLLEKNQWLSDRALIYVETEKDAILKTPSHWQSLKEKTVGQVCCRLFLAETEN